MFTSICNFLYDTFFQRSEEKLLRRKNDSSESSSGKRLKTNDCFWSSSSPLNERSPSVFSMQKENAGYSDDECCIIAELPRRKKAISNINVDQDVAVTSTRTKGFRTCSSLASLRKDLSEENNKDRQNVKCVNSTSGKELITKSNFKNKFFNNVRTSLSHGKMTKSRISYRNNLRKKLSFLQESYRLTEKLQYIQLLQTQTLLSLQSRRSAKCITYPNKCIPVIDLTDEKCTVSSDNYSKSDSESRTSEDQDIQIVGEFSGVRSFEDILKIKPINANESLEKILSVDLKSTPSVENLKLNSKESSHNTISLLDDDDDDDNDDEGDDDDDDDDENQTSNFDILEEKLKNYMKITLPDFQEADDFKLHSGPKLTKEQESRIANALVPEPKQEILVKGFGLQITRHDMQTLKGLNWLNDAVIDFYMNLIMERSKLCHILPNVYAFNTFFYPKLITTGYDGLQRWTKRVDIFSFDIILVPVHLGMHWCLSVIDFRSKSVQYYDSVGSPNDECLEKLLFYLKAESLCKKKTIFHTSDWEKRNVKDIPQQMNGSDCGVFSCMFAEFVTRDSRITFSQRDMPYFRKKMVIEILQKRLLT